MLDTNYVHNLIYMCNQSTAHFCDSMAVQWHRDPELPTPAYCMLYDML